MIRTLIVAPYAALRTELEALIADTADIAVVGAIGGSEDLEPLLEDVPTDVILFDSGDEEEDLHRLLDLAIGRELSGVILDDQTDTIQMLADSRLVAWSLLKRNADNVELGAAIRAVAAGLVVLDRTLVTEWRPSAYLPATLNSTENQSLVRILTVREREVLKWMAHGLANKQIGGRLSISLHTVKFHVASILAKLDAASRTEAVTIGARRGLVTL